jgi:hypothetical protein
MHTKRWIPMFLLAFAALPACADDTTQAVADTTVADAADTDDDAADVADDATSTADDAVDDAAGAEDVSADATETADTTVSSPAPTQLAVVGSDYLSVSISALDLEKRVVSAPGFLDSGSAVTPGGAALSGDVVVAQTPTPDGRLVLIDRGTGVLSFVDAVTRKVGEQLSVATGFYANPQDFLQVSSTRAVVSRMSANASPTPTPDDLDEGDDLVLIDLNPAKLAARVALGPYASLPGTVAAPGRLAFDGKLVWVPLASMSTDFQTAGKGRVVAIDPQTGKVVHVVEAPESKNCVQARRLGTSTKIAVLCSGFFGEPDGKQHAYSNILVIDTAASPPVADVEASATVLAMAPFGKDLAALDERYLVTTTTGDFAKETPDTLWLLDMASWGGFPLAKAGKPFGFSGLFADGARRIVWAGEASHATGDLRVFDVKDAEHPYELPAVTSNPGGLAAVDLGAFGW